MITIYLFKEFVPGFVNAWNFIYDNNPQFLEEWEYEVLPMNTLAGLDDNNVAYDGDYCIVELSYYKAIIDELLTKSGLSDKYKIRTPDNSTFLKIEPDKTRKYVTAQEYNIILAMRGEELDYSQLKTLIGIKLECVRNFTSINFYPVTENGEIVNFVDNDNHLTESTKNYNFEDLEFSEQLDCYILNR